MKKFTRRPTICPKCGGIEIERQYHKGVWASDECLICRCFACDYKWEQETLAASNMDLGQINEQLL